MTPRPLAGNKAANDSKRSRLYYFSTGFFTQTRVRRILDLAGYDLKLGKPGPDDLVAVWGKTPTAGRGQSVASATGSGLVHIEDAFLRSIKPGRDGEPPLGLTIDHQRPYFDSSGRSDLEEILATSTFDDTHELNRARDAIARIKELQLSKYNAFDHDTRLPEPGYVLVVDQTKGDASITHGGANTSHFAEMLTEARLAYPKARILIKTHPETAGGHRGGHFSDTDEDGQVSLLSTQHPPMALLDGAIAVYTVSSGLGFEAILAGHKPKVFGQPFYAGWGLSEDIQPVQRRRRKLTRPQLFAGVMMRYSKWYDPFRDRLCEIETIIDIFESLTKAYAQDVNGHVALGMRLWKRGPLQAIFGGGRFGPKARVKFVKEPEQALRDAAGGSLLLWSNREPELFAQKATSQNIKLRRVEDGFLRSRGLGAELTPPMSLVTDDTGIYYDPTRASQLERLIGALSEISPFKARRAERLRDEIVKLGLSKYNLGGSRPDINTQGRPAILVPGQVEDDASILLGTKDITTNAELLEAVRRDYPDAYIIYKPHPDVEAGLREGHLDAPDADLVAHTADPATLLAQVDRVCTMTSLIGFEALLRGVAVSTYGAPFYAGWGLTDDRGPVPARRARKVSLDALVHATLIDYPRYHDPVSRQPCPPEIVVMRLAAGRLPKSGLSTRLLAKAQGIFASYAHLWR